MNKSKYRHMVYFCGFINLLIEFYFFINHDAGYMSVVAPIVLYPFSLGVYRIMNKTILERRREFFSTVIGCFLMAAFVLISFSDGSGYIGIFVAALINIFLIFPLYYDKNGEED